MKLVAASCANIREVPVQPAWSEILAERPDVLLLLGDNVYLERDDHRDPAALAAELHALYERQRAQPEYAALLADLRARGARLVAIYDDHDFLGNNRCGGDDDPALRIAARAEFVRAFAPATTGEDVYALHRLEEVDLVVLDARFHRTAPETSREDPDAVLGQRQWHWFEEVASASRNRYLVVASGTTLHTFGDQSWEQYPRAFARMVALLRGRRGALVISGDIHRNAAYDESGVIEIATSAVAHRCRAFGTIRKNYGVFEFSEEALSVDLRSLKVGNRFAFDIPWSNWTLP